MRKTKKAAKPAVITPDKMRTVSELMLVTEEKKAKTLPANPMMDKESERWKSSSFFKVFASFNGEMTLTQF